MRPQLRRCWWCEIARASFASDDFNALKIRISTQFSITLCNYVYNLAGLSILWTTVRSSAPTLVRVASAIMSATKNRQTNPTSWPSRSCGRTTYWEENIFLWRMAMYAAVQIISIRVYHWISRAVTVRLADKTWPFSHANVKQMEQSAI
jgi:hypothetical protein